MTRCFFCKTNYEFPRGITVVQKDGEPRYFCSSKCRKSSQMGRDSRKVKWVTKNKESQAANKLMIAESKKVSKK